MIALQTLAAFFAVAVLLSLTPGPDNIFVLLQSAMRGPKIGMLIVLGLCSGLLLHTTAVALGLSAVFAASPFAFTALKLVGAAYLAYLAWQAFRTPAAIGRTANGNAASMPMSRGQAYLRGFVMNITNAKVAIFFLAFLPQFTQQKNGSVAVQMLLLGGVFIVATLIVFGAIAYFSGAFGALLNRSARAQIILNRLAGTVFLALAINLVMTQR
jgi:threonine/homoserine/homoserine lactone efflux protein